MQIFANPSDDIVFLQGRACYHVPIEWFFPEHGQRFDRAASVCDSCPVRDRCERYYGLSEDDGYVAGRTPDERKALRRKVS